MMNKLLLVIIFILTVSCKTITVVNYERSEEVVFKDTIQNEYPYVEYYDIDIFEYKTKKALFNR